MSVDLVRKAWYLVAVTALFADAIQDYKQEMKSL
jgi:hypothetical protein